MTLKEAVAFGCLPLLGPWAKKEAVLTADTASESHGFELVAWEAGGGVLQRGDGSTIAAMGGVRLRHDIHAGG